MKLFFRIDLLYFMFHIILYLFDTSCCIRRLTLLYILVLYCTVQRPGALQGRLEIPSDRRRGRPQIPGI
jgi:hypothetical protein